MEEMEYLTLEDGITYMIVDTIEEDGKKYYYLANQDDEKDLCVRKSIDNKLKGLDSKQEFEKAIMLFFKKHKDSVEKI